MLITRLHPPQLQLKKKMQLLREVMVLSLVVQMSTETIDMAAKSMHWHIFYSRTIKTLLKIAGKFKK